MKRKLCSKPVELRSDRTKPVCLMASDTSVCDLMHFYQNLRHSRALFDFGGKFITPLLSLLFTVSNAYSSRPCDPPKEGVDAIKLLATV